MDQETMKKIKPGAIARVHEKQGGSFQGIVISRKHGSEPGATFTVRAILARVGVEKIYPIHSPNIEVKVLSSPKKVHRSKLYFVRKLSKKKSRQKVGVAA